MKLIGTHNGMFHCDEALACFMIKLLPEFSSAAIIRTRQPSELEKCDIVVDVGGVYNPETLRFDHHQRSFYHTLHSLIPIHKYTTKLSSAGLIYAHFGRDVIMSILKRKVTKSQNLQNEKILDVLYEKCYAEFIEEIDANDNGISQFDIESKPRFLIISTLPNRIANLNPAWNDVERNEDKQFEKAMDLAGKEFSDKVEYFFNVWWPARTLVLDSFQSRNLVHKSGSVIILQTICPWKEHLFDIELEENAVDSVKYCLFHDKRNNHWMINCVPVEIKSFKSRLPLPESWRGLRDQELSDSTQIPGCVFVHSSGFCGANKTKEGALKMIECSLCNS